MYKVIVIEDFTLLQRFNEIKNIIRANINNNAEGYLYVNDTFECNEDLLKYLTETNALGRAFVKVIEVIPEKKTIKKDVTPVEDKPKKRATRKKAIE